jgi:UDP-glucose 4-epimerase
MKNNFLLTGGAGYIGSHVANALIDKGHRVTIIDSLITGDERLVPKKAKLYICDIDNIEKVSQILNNHKFDMVMHFAGLIRVDESVKKPDKYLEFNYKKTKKFFNLCFKHNLKKIIFSSTASVYGNSRKKVSEKFKLSPLNPYALSKLKVENFLIKNSKLKNFKYTILRYFNVAGADQKLRTGLISKFSTHLIKIACEVAVGKRKKLIINGADYNTLDGTPVRDYIHVSDLSDIHVLTAEKLLKKQKSNIFNCGYGRGYSVKQVIEKLNDINKKKIQFKIGPRRVSDSMYVVADTAKFKKHFKWKPKYDDLKNILETALKWEKKINK